MASKRIQLFKSNLNAGSIYRIISSIAYLSVISIDRFFQISFILVPPLRKISIFYVLLVLSLLISVNSQCSSVPIQPSNLDRIDLQGHRGARGLKPENTWPGFQSAMDYNMTTLELDTVLTKDGFVIIHHDTSTNPNICKNLDGNPIQKVSIYELTLAELKKLDCGSIENPKFPEQDLVPSTQLITIDELFKLVVKEEAPRIKNGIKPIMFNIETKFPNDSQSLVSEERMKSHVRALVTSIEKYGMVERTTIQSFYLPVLPYSKTLNPKIKTSALFVPTYLQGFGMVMGGGSGYRKRILETTAEYKGDIISPYFICVNPEFMEIARKMKLTVVPWTVNEKKEMKRLISLGVDGIISDYPNRLVEVIDELKKAR